MCTFAQVRSLDTHLQPDHLKVITQQVEEEQAILQSQTLLRLQQVHAADRQAHSPQVRTTTGPELPHNTTQHNTHTAGIEENVCFHLQVPPPPAPTHHPTVIVPAPALTQHSHHHVTVVTVSPSVYTSTMSTSRQNLDTIVQVRGLNVSKLADESRAECVQVQNKHQH